MLYQKLHVRVSWTPTVPSIKYELVLIFDVLLIIDTYVYVYIRTHKLLKEKHVFPLRGTDLKKVRGPFPR